MSTGTPYADTTIVHWHTNTHEHVQTGLNNLGHEVEIVAKVKIPVSTSLTSIPHTTIVKSSFNPGAKEFKPYSSRPAASEGTSPIQQYSLEVAKESPTCGPFHSAHTTSGIQQYPDTESSSNWAAASAVGNTLLSVPTPNMIEEGSNITPPQLVATDSPPSPHESHMPHTSISSSGSPISGKPTRFKLRHPKRDKHRPKQSQEVHDLVDQQLKEQIAAKEQVEEHCQQLSDQKVDLEKQIADQKQQIAGKAEVEQSCEQLEAEKRDLKKQITRQNQQLADNETEEQYCRMLNAENLELKQQLATKDYECSLGIETTKEEHRKVIAELHQKLDPESTFKMKQKLQDTKTKLDWAAQNLEQRRADNEALMDACIEHEKKEEGLQQQIKALRCVEEEQQQEISQLLETNVTLLQTNATLLQANNEMQNFVNERAEMFNGLVARVRDVEKEKNEAVQEKDDAETDLELVRAMNFQLLQAKDAQIGKLEADIGRLKDEVTSYKLALQDVPMENTVDQYFRVMNKTLNRLKTENEESVSQSDDLLAVTKSLRNHFDAAEQTTLDESATEPSIISSAQSQTQAQGDAVEYQFQQQGYFTEQRVFIDEENQVYTPQQAVILPSNTQFAQEHGVQISNLSPEAPIFVPMHALHNVHDLGSPSVHLPDPFTTTSSSTIAQMHQYEEMDYIRYPPGLTPPSLRGLTQPTVMSTASSSSSPDIAHLGTISLPYHTSIAPPPGIPIPKTLPGKVFFHNLAPSPNMSITAFPIVLPQQCITLSNPTLSTCNPRPDPLRTGPLYDRGLVLGQYSPSDSGDESHSRDPFLSVSRPACRHCHPITAWVKEKIAPPTVHGYIRRTPLMQLIDTHIELTIPMLNRYDEEQEDGADKETDEDGEDDAEDDEKGEDENKTAEEEEDEWDYEERFFEEREGYSYHDGCRDFLYGHRHSFDCYYRCVQCGYLGAEGIPHTCLQFDQDVIEV